MKNFDLNMEKFETLIHYICFKANREKLSATKIHKILWYSEATYYLQNKVPIVGETYVKGPHGPMSPHAQKAIKSLTKQEKLVVADVKYHDNRKKEYVPLANPDLSQFCGQEISHIDSWIETVCSGSATEISEFSHNDIWKAAENLKNFIA